MALELWTPRQLLAVLRDDRLDDVPSHFLDTYFPGTYYSEDSEIRLGKLPNANRLLAPFVLPTEQGKPIFRKKNVAVSALTVPYIKPKDVVRAQDAKNFSPEDILLRGGNLPGIKEKFDARVAEIVQFHKRAIQMQIVWMAARALIDGKVQVNYDRDSGNPYPTALIDFGRAPGHTVTLGAGARWSDTNHDTMGDITSWLNTMYLATLGGTGTRMYLGAQAASAFMANPQIKDLLDTRYRGAEEVQLKRGLMRTVQPLNYLGKLDNNLEIYTYRDQVENDNGTMVEIFDPRDVLITAPGIGGVVARGAIEDTTAIETGMVNVDIFPKMWSTDDPGEKFIMHQAAPLPIPVYPNRTFKARVLA